MYKNQNIKPTNNKRKKKVYEKKCNKCVRSVYEGKKSECKRCKKCKCKRARGKKQNKTKKLKIEMVNQGLQVVVVQYLLIFFVELWRDRRTQTKLQKRYLAAT